MVLSWRSATLLALWRILVCCVIPPLGCRLRERHDLRGRHRRIEYVAHRRGLTRGARSFAVNGFCECAVAAGLPIIRALVFIDTLHPVYEGRMVRWGHDPSQPAVHEYGRTGSPLAVTDMHFAPGVEKSDMVARWRASPFFRMLQTGESMLRRRVTAESQPEFPVMRDYRAEGITDYVAIISRFGPEGTIGEMDCVYSSWATTRPEGFTDAHIAAFARVVPTLALAFKSVALARMTRISAATPDGDAIFAAADRAHGLRGRARRRDGRAQRGGGAQRTARA